MFFFVFSPLPGSTTSLKYIFAFIVDSVPTAVIIFLTIKDAYYNKKGKVNVICDFNPYTTL